MQAVAQRGLKYSSKIQFPFNQVAQNALHDADSAGHQVVTSLWQALLHFDISSSLCPAMADALPGTVKG
jgi:hypothetical protein